MAITPPRAIVPAAVLLWSGLAVAALSVRPDEAIRREGERPSLPPAPFEARWDDATEVTQERTGDDQPLLKKQDRLPLPMVNASTPEPVTERITPPAPDAPVSVPPVILVQDDDDKPPPAARHRRQRDVCTKHSMHKVVTHGGKSWRCRK